MIVRRLNLRSSLSTRLTVSSASGQSQNTRRAGWNRRKQFKPFLINNLFPSQASENRVSSWIWRSSRPGWRSSPRHGSYQPTPGMHRNFIFSVTRFLVLGTKDMTSMPSLSVVQKFTIQFSFVAKTTMWVAKWFCNIWKSRIPVDEVNEDAATQNSAYFFLSL